MPLPVLFFPCVMRGTDLCRHLRDAILGPCHPVEVTHLRAAATVGAAGGGRAGAGQGLSRGSGAVCTVL